MGAIDSGGVGGRLVSRDRPDAGRLLPLRMRRRDVHRRRLGVGVAAPGCGRRHPGAAAPRPRAMAGARLEATNRAPGRIPAGHLVPRRVHWRSRMTDDRVVVRRAQRQVGGGGGRRRHRCGRPRHVAEGGARRLEGARGRQVVWRLRHRVFEFGDRARGVAAVEQRASRASPAPRRRPGIARAPPGTRRRLRRVGQRGDVPPRGRQRPSASHATACDAGAVRAGCLSACAWFLAGPAAMAARARRSAWSPTPCCQAHW